MIEVKLHLMYGEKDGAKPIVEMDHKPVRGQIIYTWATKNDVLLGRLRHHPERYKAAVAEYSGMAYRFEGQTFVRQDGGKIEYVFRRYEQADKVVVDPAV